MLEGIQEITYFAPDVHAYYEWLAKAAGAQLEHDFVEMVQCRIGSALITLHPSDDKGPAGPGGQAAYWAVNDIHAAIALFQTYGARLFRGPIQGLDGPWVAQMQDPWGNIWGLWQAAEA